MSSDIKMRFAGESDIPALILLFRELEVLHVSSVPKVIKRIEEKDIFQMFKKFEAEEKTWSVLAEFNNEPVGFIRYRIFAVPKVSFLIQAEQIIGRIDELVVTSKFQNQGIARQLYSKAESHFSELGIKEVQLDVWSFNEPANSLYEKLGFKDLFHRKIKVLGS